MKTFAVIKRKVFQYHNFVHCTILYVLSKIHMKVNHILLGWCFCRFSNPDMFAYKTFIECLMQDYLHCCKTAQRDKWGLAWKKRRKNIDVIWRRLKSLVQISTSEIKSPAIQYSCQVFSQCLRTLHYYQVHFCSPKLFQLTYSKVNSHKAKTNASNSVMIPVKKLLAWRK